MTKVLLFIVSAAILFGCSGIENITPSEIEVTRTADFDRRAYVGTSPVTIRTRMDLIVEPWTIDTRSSHMSGVECSLEGRGFFTKFLTPATVNVPNFGYNSSRLLGSCQTQGVVKSFEIRPYNITAQNISVDDGGLVNGVLNIFFDRAAILVKHALNNEKNDEFGYEEDYDVWFPEGELQKQQPKLDPLPR